MTKRKNIRNNSGASSKVFSTVPTIKTISLRKKFLKQEDDNTLVGQSNKCAHLQKILHPLGKFSKTAHPIYTNTDYQRLVLLEMAGNDIDFHFR